jgi:hypothetical protein
MPGPRGITPILTSTPAPTITDASGDQLRIVLLEDRRVVRSVTGMQSLDQPVDPRCHHEQIARRTGPWIPE